MLPMFIIYSAICDILEVDGRITEAIGFFQHVQRELPMNTCTDNEVGKWEQSELYRMDNAGDCLSIIHRFSAAMQKEIRGARRGRNGFSELQ